MGNWIKEIVRGERWDGLFVRLCWMALVIAAIYGVQNSPLGEDWRTAIGEGIGIFGGVELILDKINDLRHRRTIAESQAKAVFCYICWVVSQCRWRGRSGLVGRQQRKAFVKPQFVLVLEPYLTPRQHRIEFQPLLCVAVSGAY